ARLACGGAEAVSPLRRGRALQQRYEAVGVLRERDQFPAVGPVGIEFGQHPFAIGEPGVQGCEVVLPLRLLGHPSPPCALVSREVTSHVGYGGAKSQRLPTTRRRVKEAHSGPPSHPLAT